MKDLLFSKLLIFCRLRFILGVGWGARAGLWFVSAR